MIRFERMTPGDVGKAAGILNHYILHTTHSFYTECLSEEEMQQKLFFAHPAFASFVVLHDDRMIGYCAVSPWKPQQAYRHTGEINLYLEPSYTGRGTGRTTLAFLETFARSGGIGTLIAGLCSENEASRRLFESCGYDRCAHFQAVGRKWGQTLDTLYYQKMLEPTTPDGAAG